MALPEIKVKVSADTAQAKSGLKSVEASLDSVTAKQAKGARQGRVYASSMKASASQTANLGAQLNDIGVMLAAGQSPLQLAVQQGTQINQVFAQMGGGKQALKGLAAGAMSMVNPMSLATLGIIAGGAALVQWATRALSAGEESDALAEKQAALAKVQEQLNDTIRASRLGASSEELTILDSIAAKRREIVELQAKADQGNIRGNRGAERALEVGQKELATLQGQLATIRNLQAEKERLVSSTRTLSDQERIVGDMTRLTGDEIERNERIAELLRQGVSATVIEALELSGVDMASGINAATLEAAQLASKLGIALGLARQIARLGGGGGASGPDAARSQIQNAYGVGVVGVNGVLSIDSNIGANNRKKGGRKSGGGGGGAGIAKDMARRLETLVESLKTEREVLEEWRVEGLELLATANEAELEALGGQHEAKLRLEKEYQERLAQIKKEGANQGLLTTLKAGQDIANAIGQSNERALKIAQSFGAAISLINAYQAASETLKDPSLPWFARIAAASSVLAAGIGFVSSIRGINSNGTGGGVGGAGGAANVPTAPQERRVAEFRFVGGDVLDPRAIVNAINDAYDSGYQIRGVIG